MNAYGTTQTVYENVIYCLDKRIGKLSLHAEIFIFFMLHTNRERHQWLCCHELRFALKPPPLPLNVI